MKRSSLVCACCIMNPLSRFPIQLALCAFVSVTAGAHDFQVRLENCTEFIGVASVALSKLQPLVPAGYQIQAGPPGFGSLVVRASHCRGASIDGSSTEAVRVGQIGIVVVSPDGTGDINNYTLSYSTNSLRLGLRLELAGLPVSLDPDLVYEVSPDPPGASGKLFVEVSPLAASSWFLLGTVGDPPPGGFPFVANWWYNGRQGKVKMSTSIPALNYGAGSVEAYTRKQSQLGGLFGGNTSSFGTNLRGVFANGVMRVSTP